MYMEHQVKERPIKRLNREMTTTAVIDTIFLLITPVKTEGGFSTNFTER